MNHDVSHCSDYDPDICPSTCYRAQVTKDLQDNWDTLYKDIPMSFAHFKNSAFCSMRSPSEIVTLVEKQAIKEIDK